MLICTNLDSFAITYQTLVDVFRGCAQFFANTERPGTSFHVAVFVEFFDEIISFRIWHKLAKFNLQTVITSQVV